MLFWKLPDNKFMAFIPKTGSTAWGQAILDKYYPELKQKQARASTPSGETASPQFLIPHVRKIPEGATVYGIFRDPIERFKSGSVAIGSNINKNIQSLHDKKPNVHIKSMTDMFGDDLNKITWIKYESKLADLVKLINLDKMPLPMNVTKNKIRWNGNQLAQLQEAYKADIEFYNKL